MYICRDCESQFEEPKWGQEYRGEYFGAPAYENCYYCPDCGSDDFEEAEHCFVCGEYFLADHAEDCCEECKEVLSNEMYALKDKYGLDSIDTLQDWICALFEW